jgi:hypothetical protein
MMKPYRITRNYTVNGVTKTYTSDFATLDRVQKSLFKLTKNFELDLDLPPAWQKRLKHTMRIGIQNKVCAIVAIIFGRSVGYNLRVSGRIIVNSGESCKLFECLIINEEME